MTSQPRFLSHQIKDKLSSGIGFPSTHSWPTFPPVFQVSQWLPKTCKIKNCFFVDVINPAITRPILFHSPEACTGLCSTWEDRLSSIFSWHASSSRQLDGITQPWLFKLLTQASYFSSSVQTIRHFDRICLYFLPFPTKMQRQECFKRVLTILYLPALNCWQQFTSGSSLHNRTRGLAKDLFCLLG